MPVKPSENEDLYFVEHELKQHLARTRAAQEAMAAAEQRKLKDLHFMCCPKCGQKLAAEKYGAIEIDVCAGCRGLWLDANELEHILASKEQAGPLRKFLRVLGA